MELLYFFQIVWRNIWKILVIGIFFTILGALFTIFFQQAGYKTTIIFQTTTRVVTEQSDRGVDPLAYFEAADRFSEAILGWFRNPIVFDDITSRVQNVSADTLSKIFSIRRQEKQNINIIYTVPTENQAKDLQEAIITYIRERISSINKESNSTYDIVNVDSKTELVTPSVTQNAAFGGLAGLVLAAILLFFWEYLRGVVMYKEQIQTQLGIKPIDHLQTKDSQFLAAYLQNIHGNIVIYTEKPMKELIINTVNELEGLEQSNRTLVDATSNAVFSDSDKASQKGFMTGGKEKLSPTLDKGVQIIPRGKGELPNFVGVSHIPGHILVSNNETVFSAITKKYIPVVFIHLGKTKLRNIHRMKSIQDSPLHIFFIG